MEKQTIRDIAYWVMITIVIATCIFIFLYISGSSASCLENPLNYYEKYMDVKCSCIRFTDFVTPK